MSYQPYSLMHHELIGSQALPYYADQSTYMSNLPIMTYIPVTADQQYCKSPIQEQTTNTATYTNAYVDAYTTPGISQEYDDEYYDDGYYDNSTLYDCCIIL